MATVGKWVYFKILRNTWPMINADYINHPPLAFDMVVKLEKLFQEKWAHLLKTTFILFRICTWCYHIIIYLFLWNNDCHYTVKASDLPTAQHHATLTQVVHDCPWPSFFQQTWDPITITVACILGRQVKQFLTSSSCTKAGSVAFSRIFLPQLYSHQLYFESRVLKPSQQFLEDETLLLQASFCILKSLFFCQSI